MSFRTESVRWLVVTIGVGIALFACAPADQTAETEATDEWLRSRDHIDDLSPFVAMARANRCATSSNRLLVIDDKLVLHVFSGTCPDARYGRTLYGGTLEDKLCYDEDSVGGPRRGCFELDASHLFETTIDHLAEDHLGLGTGHAVEEIDIHSEEWD